MELRKDITEGTLQIKAYQAEGFTVEDRQYVSSIVITPTEVKPWAPMTVDEITKAHIAALVTPRPDLVIFGLGEQLRFPDQTVLTPLIEHQIGYEVMTTQAACRTYNLISAEGRRVVAALLK